MLRAPDYLQDAKNLLTSDGFTTTGLWYHGTSSALLDSIISQGLKRSGDNALNEAVKSTMATIGNKYTQSEEPVFLTQSKELAYYWAQQRVKERNSRFEGEEEAVVLEVKLSGAQQEKVRPDVGAKGLLLMEIGEHFMTYLAGIYQSNGLDGPFIDLMNADRMEFLDKLGMAYLDEDVAAGCVELVTE